MEQCSTHRIRQNCPYVLSIGGTQLNDDDTVLDARKCTGTYIEEEHVTLEKKGAIMPVSSLSRVANEVLVASDWLPVSGNISDCQ